MRFDDRLMTVLEQPASDPHDRAVRWRQLVDLVARAGAQTGNPLIASALESIRADRSSVDPYLRAAAARAIAALPLPFDLVALFASDTMTVAAPVLAAARLQPEEWRKLMAEGDEETRNFIATLHPDLGGAETAEPQVDYGQEEGPAVEGAEPASFGQAIPSISEVVARIERLRRSRGHDRGRGMGATEQPLHSSSAPALFRWECDPSGDIAWVEGAPRGALVGRSIARSDEDEGVGDEVERAFAIRSPFHDARFVIPGQGAIAGEWKISGVPAFEPANGRFAGYRGIALRESDGQPPSGRLPSLPVADPDSLRELVHELKTPLNAIIGFAEIIDGQFLGPADRHYRTRAAEIVTQAKLLLSAIDDLDFAAKLQADRDRPGGGTDIGLLLQQVVAGMRQAGAQGPATLDLSIDTARRRCALEPALAERLVTRFCSAAVAAAAPGEVLLLHVDNEPGRCLLWLDSPADSQVASSIGLRLVGGLARIAGGDLTTGGGRVTLALPEA